MSHFLTKEKLFLGFGKNMYNQEDFAIIFHFWKKIEKCSQILIPFFGKNQG